MTPRRAAISALVIVLALTAASACTDSSSSPSIGSSTGIDSRGPAVTDDSRPTDPTKADPIEWGACDDPEATDEVLQCATLSVPLDHTAPDGEHIDIALVRVPASDPDDRVGAILFNPGGPGGSGFDYVAQGGTTIVESLGLEDFDLIGFDPRGVDRSNGLRCLTDAEQDATQYLDETPDTPDEQAALDAANDQFEAACIAKFGDTLRHYSTDETARDMDAIRAGLGDDQISYLGISYGTYLGATYATLFPDRVRAMVLDSAFEPTGDTIEQEYTTQLVGFEEAFNNWAAWCEGSAECAFHSDDVGAAWDELSDQLDTAPVMADDGRPANQTVFNVATISALYSETDWPVLAAALADVRDGDAASLFRLADSYVGRSPDGTYSTIQQSGAIIRCASGIDAEVPDDPAALLADLQELAPRFSRGITVDDFEDSCNPLMPDVTPAPLAYEGDASIVVIGGSNDPATPFRWAEEMDAAMGPEAGLVTYTGEGHGFLLASDCVTEIEAATLVDGDVPDDGTVCDPDPEMERPDWWDDLPVPDGVSDVFDSPEINSLLGLGPTLAYSELRTSALDTTGVLDAYDASLESAGFQVGGRQEPIPGIVQGVYLEESGELFSVLVIGPDGMEEPDLEGLAELVPEGQTLVVLLALPG
jgi:pimeloyl-ACP methyl ester carboxylesterase